MRAAFRRAKWLAAQGVELFATPALRYFLYQHVTADCFRQDGQSLHQYAMLDDTDVYAALKIGLRPTTWCCQRWPVIS